MALRLHVVEDNIRTRDSELRKFYCFGVLVLLTSGAARLQPLQDIVHLPWLRCRNPCHRRWSSTYLLAVRWVFDFICYVNVDMLLFFRKVVSNYNVLCRGLSLIFRHAGMSDAHSSQTTSQLSSIWSVYLMMTYCVRSQKLVPRRCTSLMDRSTSPSSCPWLHKLVWRAWPTAN